MELAFLVWMIGILHNLGAFFGFLGVAFVAFGVVNLFSLIENTRPNWPRYWKFAFPVALFAFFINSLIPTEKTGYLMLGAYATQKIVTDPRSEEVGGKVLKIINQKLDGFINEKKEEKK